MRAAIVARMQLILGLVGCLVLGLSATAQIPAFPGAEGFGAYATGGRGGDVYTVVNLSSSGPGSLRYGVETAPAQGRTIVFAVSGYIPINYNADTGNQTVRIVQNKVTIAGQTAPGDGIGLKDGRILVTGNNVVLRHLRIRHGKYGGAGDCLNLESSADNSIIDHVSLMFSTDENISFFNSSLDNFTMQYSTSSWGMERHNAGGLWDLQDGSCHHSLWAHHRTRNPKARPYGVLEWINNVTYHWRSEGFIMGDSQTATDWYANVVGCYFLSIDDYEFGLKTTALSKARIASNGQPNFHIYLDNCLHDADGDGLLNGTDKGYGIVAGVPYPTGGTVPGTVSYDQSPTAFAGATGAAAVSIDDPLTAYKKVISSAGALRLDATYAGTLRDELDTLLIESVENQESILVAKDSPLSPNDPPSNGEAQLAGPPYNISNGGFGTLNTGVAPEDTDLDGMPDYWELTLGSNVSVDDHNNPVPAGAYVPNLPVGYTLLEEYLHFLAIPHATISKSTTESPSSLTTDLRKFTSGFNKAPVVYTISNPTNGLAVVQPDGYTVVFTPTLNVSGRARFDFTVTDGDGSTWTQTMGVLVTAVGIPRDLKWAGDGSANLWDTNALNFLAGASATAFDFGDNVVFDDAGSASPAASLVGVLPAGSVVVNSSQNYTFSGSGSLAGAASLDKTGSGTLTIGTANSYGGGTALGGGGIILANKSANSSGLGSGAVTLHNATLELYGANAGDIDGSGLGTFPNNLVVSENESGTFLAPFRYDLNSSLTGGGTFNIRVNGVRGNIVGNWSAFAGQINVTSRTGTSDFRVNNSSGYANAAIDLGPNTYFYLNQNPPNSGDLTAYINIGELTGDSTAKLGGNPVPGRFVNWVVGGLGTDAAFAGTIQDMPDSETPFSGIGQAKLTKAGSGIWTLTGNNTYSGSTAVQGGTLLIDGNTGPGAVTVSAGATLGGAGAMGGAVTAETGSFLSPGSGSGQASTLNVGSGLDLSGTTLLFDLSSNPASGNDQILMSGGTLIYRTPAAFFQFNLIDGVLGPGTYTLITGGAGTSAPGSPSLGHNLPSGGRQTFALQRSGGGSSDAFARLVVSGSPGSLVWQGNNGANWDLSTTNWLNGITADRYYNFDAITLDDTAASGSVNIIGTLQPLSMLVSNSGLAYTLSGGTLDGPMSLTKTGSGTLTVNNTFGHTGGTTLKAGTVVLAANTALGLNPVTLSGGTLAAASGDFEVPLVVDGSGTFLASALTHTYVKEPLTGNGTLTILPSGNLWTYETDLSGFTGSIVLSGNGSLRLNQGAFVWGSPQCTFDLGSSGTLNNRATTFEATVYLGALTGNAGSTLMPSEKSDGPGLVDTYIVGQLNLDTAFNGSITDGPAHALALTKVGAGELTLTGGNDYSGGTAVESGALIVNNASGSGTGTGSVTIESGATLGGSGSVAGPVDISDGAILAPGNSMGTFTCGGDLTLSEFSELEFDLGTSSDLVVVEGSLAAAGTIHVSDAGGFAPGIYTLFQWNTNASLTVGSLSIGSVPPGYYYAISTDVPGAIQLIVASPIPPGFDQVTVTGGNLVLSGSGGIPGGEYQLLESTNLNLPVSQWNPVVTNLFDAGGLFSITNPMTINVPREFFRLQTPVIGP